jgi:hypothetical protein
MVVRVPTFESILVWRNMPVQGDIQPACGGHANVNGDYRDRERGLQRIVNSASVRS